MALGILKTIANLINDSLKKDGFTKKGLTWNRRIGEVVQVIDVQACKSSITMEGTFTVNVGVLLPQAYRLFWQKEVPQFVQETDCVIRTRIGKHLHDGSLGTKVRDAWWSYDSSVDSPALAAIVASRITTNVYPHFNKVHNSQTMFDYLINNSNYQCYMPPDLIYRCILDIIVNGVDSDRLIALEELKSRFTGWVERIELIKEEVQLGMGS